MASVIRGSDNFDSASKLTQSTTIASTSGTSIDFTGIPSTAKRITVMFNGVSTNGSAALLVQLGAGSITNSGYFSAGQNLFTTNYYQTAYTTAGFGIQDGSSSDTRTGILILTLISSNTWVGAGSFATNTSGAGVLTQGSISLSGTLDRIRITATNGTDAFDAGTINIMWEG